MSGKVRFYSDETTVAGELGPMEGILIPRGVKYWFESVGDEPLEILQLECSDKAMRTQAELMSDIINYNQQKRGGPAEQFEA